MGLLFDTLNSLNENLARELSAIYAEACAIWGEQALQSFTAHGPIHLQQVERNLDALALPLHNLNPPLSAYEIYVLLAACYLHDIGMQLDVDDAREKHAEYSYQLILNSFPLDPRSLNGHLITLPIADRNARRAIARVARGHWTGYALLLEEEAYIRDTNERGRLRLLGLLLATADLLDMSPARARYFRNLHRLYRLDAMGEIHQKMHHFVRGNQIVVPDPNLPNELRFELEWDACTEDVRELSDWQMFWLTSEWRRLSGALTRQSKGLIRWTSPWAHVTFNRPEGPLQALSEEALCVLRAGIAEQRRVDRDEFIERFKLSLAGHERVLLNLLRDSGSDAEALANWCYAHARSLGTFQVATVDMRAPEPVDLASSVSQLMEQWGEHLPRMTSDEALRRLSEHVRSATQGVLTILAVDQVYPDFLNALVHAVLDQPNPGTGPARVCILLVPDGGSVRVPDGVVVYGVDLLGLAREDVARYMTEQLGFEGLRKERILSILVGLDRLNTPALVRSFLHDEHCEWREFNICLEAVA